MVKSFRLGVTIATCLLLSTVPALAEDAASTKTSVYGALFQVGHLADSSASVSATEPQPQPQPNQTPMPQNEGNTESVLMYYPDSDGFIAVTTNNAGAQWWTSDKFGMNWTQAETNPLTSYGCTQAGRHSVELFNGNVYFGASCETGALLFKVTSLTTVELVHTLSVTGQNGMAQGFPTASVVNDTLVEFFNGGYSKSSDGTTWTDVTNAKNQPDSQSVPLEVSTEHDKIIDVAFTTGQVATLDITTDTYTIIGEDYLENLDPTTQQGSANLPAIEYYNGTIWVGNQDMENGASIFKNDATDSDGDGNLWPEVKQLDVDDMIVNKMELSNKINGTNYLVYFTSNAKKGTNIVGIDADGNFINVVNSGLGGENPENNTEVVSLVERKVTAAGQKLNIMLFGTQNKTDQTKIFALQLADDLAISPSDEAVVSTPSEVELSAHRLQATAVYTTEGEPFKMQVDATQVNKGDVFTLFVDGKKVQRKKATNGKALILTYTGAKNLETGDTFTVQVGRKLAYGTKKSGRVLSRNIVKGETLEVTVK